MAKITISIPGELKEKLDEIIKDTNFKSIQDYLLFFLEQIVSGKGTEKKIYTEKEEAGIKGNVQWNKEDIYTTDEEKELKRRLRELGYVDEK